MMKLNNRLKKKSTPRFYDFKRNISLPFCMCLLLSPPGFCRPFPTNIEKGADIFHGWPS
jgi:hypothetical protein